MGKDFDKMRILLVEDNEFFRDAVKLTLEGAGYQVVEAPDGKVARDILPTLKVDLIISDIQMPFLNGVELLEWTRSNIEVKFMLMTGFAHILETQKASELGADDFIAKPFSDQELLEKVRNLIDDEFYWNSQSQEEKREEVYCKVSLEDFVSDKAIELDIFIKLKSNKFIKIAHKGGKLDNERIENYRSKGISELFIRKEDFPKIIDFNVKLSKLVAGNSTISVEKKERFLLHTAEVILEQTFVVGVDEQSYSVAKDFINISVDLLTQDDQSFLLLNSLSNHTDYLYAHSLGVSMYSVMIAKKMGWTSTANLFKLAFSGMMHDIGKKEIDPELLNKSRPELSFKERKEIETHTSRGRSILENLKSAPSEAVAVAYQHHENILGHGFPQQLSKDTIHPMAKIVSVANEFCNYAIKNAHHPQVDGRKAISLLDSLKADTLDKIAYKALKDLFSK
ncbi:MAG: response regulator [Bdellovibrionales bacterium]|nr:response regulator [Bdellovibrionales bacterium]